LLFCHSNLLFRRSYLRLNSLELSFHPLSFLYSCSVLSFSHLLSLNTRKDLLCLGALLGVLLFLQCYSSFEVCDPCTPFQFFLPQRFDVLLTSCFIFCHELYSVLECLNIGYRRLKLCVLGLKNAKHLFLFNNRFFLGFDSLINAKAIQEIELT